MNELKWNCICTHVESLQNFFLNVWIILLVFTFKKYHHIHCLFMLSVLQKKVCGIAASGEGIEERDHKISAIP